LRERGLDVSLWDPAFASSSPPPRSSFDLALCIEVAEHFLDPVADFGEYASRLKPGGYAALHTHFAPADDEEFLRWWYIEDLTHVSFYTEKSLRILGRIATLAVVSMEDGKLAIFRRPLPVLVAGGANLDVEGRPHAPLVASDSNPGVVRFAPGGTGRNIAEDLARLGVAVELVAAIGSDAAGSELEEHTAATGVGTVGLQRMEGEASSCYLAVLDADGDMAVAVNGMGIYDRFYGELALAAAERAVAHAAETSFAADLRAPFSALVLDGNLLPETSEALLDRFPGLNAWFDPISTVKARRFAAYRDGALLGRLAAAKPNLMQAETMAALVGSAVSPATDPSMPVPPSTSSSSRAERSAGATRSAHALRSAGVGVIYVSLGSEGVYRLSAGIAATAVAPSVEVVSATGAGDAFLAGALRGALLGLSAEEECSAGLSAAAIALTSAEACPADLDGKKLEDLLSAWKRRGAPAWKEERT
jgi:pseudouridine kinase